MKVGYVRASAEDQNTARQIVAMKANGVEKIFEEKKSGKNADREQLKAMLSFVREGDTVITESISRIARNTRDLLGIVEQVEDGRLQPGKAEIKGTAVHMGRVSTRQHRRAALC